MRRMLRWLPALFVLPAFATGHAPSSTALKEASTNKHIQKWMDVEKRFQELDEKLEAVLESDFGAFRSYMTDKIQEHHAPGSECMQGPFADHKAKATTYDECSGKGSLTESESILHQALDHFTVDYKDKERIQRLHEEAHAVFTRTRSMLQDMSLLQSSEFDSAVLAKREALVRLYATDKS